MAGMPIRRARKAIRDKQIKEEAVREALGPNGANLYPSANVLGSAPKIVPPPVEPEAVKATEKIALRLLRATELAVEDAIATLEMSIDRSDPDFARLKQLKTQAGATVAGILARVNPSTLRAAPVDRMQEILDSLKGNISPS